MNTKQMPDNPIKKYFNNIDPQDFKNIFKNKDGCDCKPSEKKAECIESKEVPCRNCRRNVFISDKECWWCGLPNPGKKE